MKKLFFLGLVCILLWLTVLGSISCGSHHSPRPIDCQTDWNCFVKASKNCHLAKLTYSASVDVFGVVITETVFYEIRGMEANKCTLYLRMGEINVRFSDKLIQQLLATGLTQEQIQQMEQEANIQMDTVEGLDGICKFDKNDLAAMLDRWAVGQFSTDDWKITECEGGIFSQQSK